MRRSEYGLLVILAAMWGLSYTFYRIGAPPLGPALFVDLRVALASLVFLPYWFGTGRWPAVRARLRQRWRPYLVLGVLNSALPFTLIAFGELQLPASYSSVLNATAPLFGVVLGAAWFGVPITPKRAGGIGLGIVGVAVLVGAAPFHLTPAFDIAVAATVAASVSYAVAASYVKSRFSGEDPILLAFGGLLTASGAMAPVAAVEVPQAHYTQLAILAVVGIALLCTVLAYVLYFRILQSAGPTSALTVTFLMPIFGVIWGHLLLGEPIGFGVIAGTAIVLLAVGLVTDLHLRRPTSPRRPPTPVPESEG